MPNQSLSPDLVFRDVRRAGSTPQSKHTALEMMGWDRHTYPTLPDTLLRGDTAPPPTRLSENTHSDQYKLGTFRGKKILYNIHILNTKSFRKQILLAGECTRMLPGALLSVPALCWVPSAAWRDGTRGQRQQAPALLRTSHTCPQMVLEGESSGGQAPHSRGPTSLQQSTSNTVVFPFNSS